MLLRGVVPAAFTFFVVAGITSPASAFGKKPWPPRGPVIFPPPAHQLRDVSRWPAEPVEPAEIDPARFRASVDHLCEKANGLPAAPTEETPEHPLGDLVRTAAASAGVDPFLLAGLMFEESGCHPDLESPRGRGLLRLHPAMYRSPGAPPAPGDKDEWEVSSLKDPASNLRLGAKLLRMWQDSHGELDVDFGGVPHRSPVSHFVWGDVVRGSGAEDMILTARRRLLQRYLSTPEKTVRTASGFVMVSPLEGTPRVASSGPGEERAGGKRRHRGIDIGAAVGEPVRAVADGTVMFAGANLPNAPRDSIPPAKIARYRWRNLGAGGIYICIEHAPDRHIVTCYMHLDTYCVSEGDKVVAGQAIGRVGRTGVQLSPPHLHFELRVDEKFVDPARQLGELVIPPRATQTYRLVMQAKRAKVGTGIDKDKGAKDPGAGRSPAQKL